MISGGGPLAALDFHAGLLCPTLRVYRWPARCCACPGDVCWGMRALRWCKAAAASLTCSTALSSSTSSCLWGHLPPRSITSPWFPQAVGCTPLPWLHSIGLLSKQLKLAFVHFCNASPPHATLVRKRPHWLAQLSLDFESFQPSISPNIALCRVHRYFCLSAPTGGLEKK